MSDVGTEKKNAAVERTLCSLMHHVCFHKLQSKYKRGKTFLWRRAGGSLRALTVRPDFEFSAHKFPQVSGWN